MGRKKPQSCLSFSWKPPSITKPNELQKLREMREEAGFCISLYFCNHFCSSQHFLPKLTFGFSIFRNCCKLKFKHALCSVLCHVRCTFHPGWTWLMDVHGCRGRMKVRLQRNAEHTCIICTTACQEIRLNKHKVQQEHINTQTHTIVSVCPGLQPLAWCIIPRWPASALWLTNGPSGAAQDSIHHSYAAVSIT